MFVCYRFSDEKCARHSMSMDLFIVTVAVQLLSLISDKFWWIYGIVRYAATGATLWI
jgi:hypothetical protein